MLVWVELFHVDLFQKLLHVAALQVVKRAYRPSERKVMFVMLTRTRNVLSFLAEPEGRHVIAG